MAGRWVGRLALVTGASVGIGAAIARKLVIHGMTVVGCANKGIDKVKTTAEELKSHASGVLHPIKCDVSRENDIKAMFSEIKEKFGGVDVCVNNAGLSFNSPLMSGDTGQWRYTLEVNVMALAICTRESIYQMTERGIDDGHIFHINSLSGHRVYGSGFYAGTKHMVTAMTEGLRQELREKKSNIRVTSISPGIVRTEFEIRRLGDEEGNKIYNQMKNLEADDIANSLVHALHAPSYCQIHDILIRPIEQER